MATFVPTSCRNGGREQRITEMDIAQDSEDYSKWQE